LTIDNGEVFNRFLGCAMLRIASLGMTVKNIESFDYFDPFGYAPFDRLRASRAELEADIQD